MPEPRIVVIGSTNADLTVLTDHLPAPGETVLGGELIRAGGGKGANQAVAAARAGASVSFVGRVGEDDFGEAMRERMRQEGIDTALLTTDEHSASGVALIIVEKSGENLIAVAPGANSRVSPHDVGAASSAVGQADLVLLQLEIPLETVEAAAALATEAGTAVMLNPAPAHELPPELLANVDYLTPNAGEAARLLGRRDNTEPEELARALTEMGVGTVVLTLGADGACACEAGDCFRVPAPRVEAVDSVGAGDCFCGVLATAIAEGRSLRDSVAFATCAAALSVCKEGAQPSLPHRREIEKIHRAQKAD